MNKWLMIGLVTLAVLPAQFAWSQDDCVDVANTDLTCIADTEGDLDLTFEIVNNTTFPIDRIFLWPDPLSNVPLTPTEYILIPVAPGTSSGPLNAQFAAGPNPQLCFELSVHNSSSGECCARGVCQDIPNCNGEPQFVRGDCTGSAGLGLPDAIVLLNYLFLGGSIGCQDACDVIDDGSLGLTDVISLLNYLFLGGSTPTAPFPSCGSDPSADALTCNSTPCP